MLFKLLTGNGEQRMASLQDVRYEMQVNVMKRLLAIYYYITIKSQMDVTPDTSLILTNDTSAG